MAINFEINETIIHSAMVKWTLYLVGVLVVYGSSQVSGQFNYNKCENAICVGFPQNCLATWDCLAIGKVVKINSSIYEFEVQTIPEVNRTTSTAYVTIKFASLDSRIEDDSLVECVMSNNKTEVFTSYTRKDSKSADLHEKSDEIKVKHKSYTNGSIHCIFQREAATAISNQTVDINELPYNLLISVGYELDDNTLRRHTNRIASPQPLVSSVIIKLGEGNENIDYDACGVVYTCFGMPSGCTIEKNCHTAIAITYTSPTYKFQMMTSSGTTYVAVALSTDNLMGGDSVVECVRENDKVNMYTSYTRVDHTGTDRHSPNGVANLLNSSYVDGKIYCYVERNEVATVSGQKFDLANQPFYILIAIGDEVITTGIAKHREKQASSEAIILHDFIDLKAGKPLLIQLHGSFMIIAWMGTAAVGLVLARYFKNQWPDKQIFGKDLWFVGHVGCMVITWTLTLAAFIIIFVHVGGWTKTGQAHGIIGTIVTVLCFFHAIGAAFRPNPKHEKRYFFNIGHYLFGRILFLLAIVNIFYAIFLESAQIPLWFIAIMGLYILIFWGNHILMGTMVYLTNDERGLFSIIRVFFGPAKRMDYEKGEYSAWYVRQKMTVFLVYLCAIIAFVITGVLVVIYARN